MQELLCPCLGMAVDDANRLRAHGAGMVGLEESSDVLDGSPSRLLMKALAVLACVSTVLCLYVFGKYRELVEAHERMYVVETSTGRVWSIGRQRWYFGYETAIHWLLPWTEDPPSVPNPDDTEDEGFVRLARDSKTCRKLVSDQVACMDAPSRVESQEHFLIDYVATKGPLPRSERVDPLIDAVLARVLPAHRPEEEASPVFAIRAALVRPPTTPGERWQINEIGPAIAFQGRGAAYFARVTGIHPPGWEDFR